MRFFENGALVHTIFPDGSGEFVASFQYRTDADTFCCLPRDTDGPMYLRTCLYSGEMRAFVPNPKNSKKGKSTP